MTIVEMHSWFRQYAQEMGMQNVRAMLPDQIDNVINTSSEDIVDTIVKRDIGVTNENVVIDNAKLANVNALSTLYKVYEMQVASSDVDPSTSTKLSRYNNGIKPYRFDSSKLPSYRYIVDFSVSYGKFDEDTSEFVEETRLFPVRNVEDSYLAKAQNDFAMTPRVKSPIVVAYGKTTLDTSNEQSFVEDNKQTFDIYFGKTSSLENELYLGKIRVSYIKSPVKVSYQSWNSGIDVNSDLPEQLQIPMLKHAVDLYRISTQGSLFANQQSSQQTQQNVSNNANPGNDGYQS